MLEQNKGSQERLEKLEKVQVVESKTPKMTEAEAKEEVLNSSVKQTDLDLAVPESPAFAVLGLSPQNVIRPTSPRQLATELLNGIDQNGNFQSGIAIDFAPHLLILGDKLTIREYRDVYKDNKKVKNNYITRLFSRTQLSVATAKGVNDDDKSIRLATGLRVTLFDLGDPRLDTLLTDCFENALTFPEPKQGETNEDYRKRFNTWAETSAKPKLQECRNDARKRNWNQSSWAIGVVPTWISTSGDTSDLEWDGVGVWSSLAYGFEVVPTLEDTSQFIIYAQYRTDEEVPLEGMSGKFLTQNSVFIGGRLLVSPLSNKLFIAEFKGGYIYQDPDDRKAENSYVFSIAGNVRIIDNVWLEISVGGRSKDSNGDGQAFVLSSLKWGFQSAPTLGQK